MLPDSQTIFIQLNISRMQRNNKQTGSKYGKWTSSYMALFYSSTQTPREKHQFSCVIETIGNPN